MADNKASGWEDVTHELKKVPASQAWEDVTHELGKPGSVGDSAQAYVEGFGRSVPIIGSYLPNINAAVGGLIPDPRESQYEKLRAEGFNIEAPKKDTYESRLIEERQRIAQQEKEHPYASTAGKATGLLVSGGVASKALSTAATVGGRIAQGAVMGASQGALENPEKENESGLINIDQRLKNTAVGGVLGGAVGSAAEAVAPLARKGLAAVTGVSDKVLKKYIANSDRINNSKTLEELKDSIDLHIRTLSQDVEGKKIDANTAKESVNQLKAQISTHIKEMKIAAGESKVSAEKLVEEAQNKSLSEVTENIKKGLETLRADVVKGSAASFEALGKSDKKIAKQPIIDFLNNSSRQLDNQWSQASQKAKGTIDKYLERAMSDKDDFISLTKAKEIIKGIDDDTALSYDKGVSAFGTEGERILKTLRKSISDTAKEASPEYKEIMERVAADTSLLKKAAKFSDNPAQAISTLLKREDPRLAANSQLMGQLEKRLKTNYSAYLEQSTKVPKQALATAGKNLKRVKSPGYEKEQVQKGLLQSEQHKGLVNTERGLLRSEERLKPFTSLKQNAGGQTTTEAKLKAITQSRNNIENDRMFQKLSKDMGIDINQMADDIATLKSFDKDTTNGSRKAVMFGGAGAGIAGAVGLPVPAGFGVGTFIGGMADKYGAQGAKKIIDVYLKSPEISPAVKDQLKKALTIGLVEKNT